MKDCETLEAKMSDLSANKLQPDNTGSIPMPFQSYLNHIVWKGWTECERI